MLTWPQGHALCPGARGPRYVGEALEKEAPGYMSLVTAACILHGSPRQAHIAALGWWLSQHHIAG